MFSCLKAKDQDMTEEGLQSTDPNEWPKTASRDCKSSQFCTEFGVYLSEEFLQQGCSPVVMKFPAFGRVADVSSVQQQG